MTTQSLLARTRACASALLAISAAAIVAITPETANATPQTQDLVIDQQANYILRAPEPDAGDDAGALSEEIAYLFTLVDRSGAKRVFNAGMGVYVFVEEGFARSDCTNNLLLGGAWNPACSDIVCVTNNAAGDQGNLWVFSDTPSAADLAAAPPSCFDNTQLREVLVEIPGSGQRTLINTIVGPLGGIGANFPLHVAFASDTKGLVATGNSDIITIGTPALSTYAVSGLAVLLGAIGVIFARRRSNTSHLA